MQTSPGPPLEVEHSTGRLIIFNCAFRGGSVTLGAISGIIALLMLERLSNTDERLRGDKLHSVARDAAVWIEVNTAPDGPRPLS